MAALLAAMLLGCTHKGTAPLEIERSFPPAPTAPESLLAGIEVIYNDRAHTADERLAAYASLLDSAFVFDAGIPSDGTGEHFIWWLNEELAAHQHMFDAQEAGYVTSIELRLSYGPATDLDPPELRHEGWKQVFVQHVFLQLMVTPTEGLEVNGIQCAFRCPPPVDGRFRIGEWNEYPRPGKVRSTESTTWSAIKAAFNGLKAQPSSAHRLTVVSPVELVYARTSAANRRQLETINSLCPGNLLPPPGYAYNPLRVRFDHRMR